MNDERLSQRLRSASEAIEMSDSAQARHLDAISAALDARDGTVVGLSAARSNRRRRFVASVVAAAVIAPAGLAAASEGSVPGDALYPIKQLSERVLVLFDSDVIARHRVEEIERLEASGRFDPELYDNARAALGELEEGHPLWERLAAAGRTTDAADSDSMTRDDDHRSDSRAIDVQLDLPDGRTASFTISGGVLIHVIPPAGWTVVALDDDEATLRSVDFEVEVEVRDDASLDTEITDRRAAEGEDSSDDSNVDDDDGEVQPPPSPGRDPDDDAGSDSDTRPEDDEHYPGEDDSSTDD